MSAFGALWGKVHPIEARLLGGSSRQPDMSGPRWHMTSPGRYEMEGGVPQSMQADGNYRSGHLPQSAAPVSPLLPQFPMQTGGGLPPQMQPPGMTGGPMAPMGGFAGMTGGGGQRMGGNPSSYAGSSLMPRFDPEPGRQPNPFARFGMYR